MRRLAGRWPLWLGPFVLVVILNLATTGAGLYALEHEQNRSRREAAAISDRALNDLCEARNDDRDAIVRTLRKVGVDEADIAIYREENPSINCAEIGAAS